MPITLRPGMVATRADSADMLRAMSSASWMTRLALMPLAGSSSYMVTTGPGRTSTMSPRTWKSSSTLSSSRALRSRPARSILPLGLSGGGGEQVERRQLVIVAKRQAGLAGKRALALLRVGLGGRRDRPGRIGHRDRRTRAGRSCNALVVIGQFRGSAGAGEPGWCRGGTVQPPIVSPQAGCRARASRSMNPPRARIAISAQPQRSFDLRIADQLHRRNRHHRRRRGQARRHSRQGGPTRPIRRTGPSATPISVTPSAATSSARRMRTGVDSADHPHADQRNQRQEQR